MPLVKKIGSAGGILPSLDELRSIQRIRALRVFMDPRDVEYPYRGKSLLFDADRRRLESQWRNIKYYRQSKTMSGMLDDVAKTLFLSNVPVHGCRHVIVHVWGSRFDSPEVVYDEIQQAIRLSEDEPVKLTFLSLTNEWIFKGFHYSTEGPYSDEQFKLLILEEFDKERKNFERLKHKFDSAASKGTS